jgi:thiaminase
MKFTESLWVSIGDIYDRILKHPFIRGLTEGSLEEDAFRFYVIQDAFGAAHRAQPSIVGWPKMLAGPTAVREFETMNKILEKPARPVTMLIGGAKAN